MSNVKSVVKTIRLKQRLLEEIEAAAQGDTFSEWVKRACIERLHRDNNNKGKK